MMKHTTVIFAIAALSCTSSVGEADVIFTRSGFDLLIDINAPITFTATAASNQFIYGLVFEDVHSSPILATNALPPIDLGTSHLTFNGNTALGAALWGNQSFLEEQVDPTDFFGYYRFQQAQSLAVNDTVVVAPGVITLTEWFLDGSAVIPDISTSTVQLISNTRTPLSDPVNVAAVPEPGPLVLLTSLGLAGVFIRRRRLAPQDTTSI